MRYIIVRYRRLGSIAFHAGCPARGQIIRTAGRLHGPLQGMCAPCGIAGTFLEVDS